MFQINIKKKKKKKRKKFTELEVLEFQGHDVGTA